MKRSSLLERLSIAKIPIFQYEFMPTEVHLVSSEPSNVSTIFGSNDKHHIILTGENIKKLPHNFIQACVSNVAEGRSILGYTPDIVFDDNSFIEIVTSQRNTDSALTEAISSKLTKYQALIDSVPDFNIIAVNRSDVLCYHGSINEEHKRIICAAYQQGLNILNEYNHKYKTEEVNLVNQILSTLPKKRKVKEIRDDIPHDDVFHPNLEKKMSFSDYKKKFTSQVIDNGAAIQLAMVIPTNQGIEDAPLAFSETNTMIALWTEALLHFFTHKTKSLDFTTLETLQCLKRNDQIPSIREPQAYDEFRVKLSYDERLELAIRGLWAKKYSDHPILQEKRNRKKNGISWDQSTDDVSMFLDCSSKELLFGCSKFVDAYIREIVLNCKRNIKVMGKFIIRKINNYDAFILIKTTRKSTDDDRPVFYSLLFKNPRFLNSRLFLQPKEYSPQWFYTEFTSLSLRKCEHLIGLDLQLKAHDQGLMEDLDDQYSIKSLMHTSLVLMSDTNELSLFTQQLRYYYMELFSGNNRSIKASEKICEKFPYPVRSRVTLFYIHSLFRIHSTLKQEILNVNQKYSDDESAAKDLLPSVEGLFGFRVMNLTTMLRSSYMCMLKNKDAQNKGHDSKIILNKMLKYEFIHMTKNQKPPKNLSEFKLFDYSEKAIYNESKEYLSSLAQENGMTIDEFKKEIIRRSVLRTPIADLTSTKSTSIVHPNDEHDKRSKVFIELLKLYYNSSHLFSNFLQLYQQFSWDTDRISLFKKNQIGGVREIYILPIILRLLIRCVEDCSRSFCELDRCEKLTDPDSREKFVDMHFMKVHSVTDPETTNYRTLKWSGDMSSWANLFEMRQFEVMIRSMFPIELQPMCIMMTQKMKKKIFRLPDQVIKNFNERPNTELSPELTKLKREYLASNDKVIVGRDSFIMESNMMQGIFHYTSSLYHSIYLKTLCKNINKLFPQAICSYEVSSDDEGLLITIHSEDKEELNTQCNKLKMAFLNLKEKCDLLFGVRTSYVKSTLSFKDLFEFNSKFTLGNCLRSPLVKFIARSVDDNPAETLRDRISSFHQQLRQVRENGGSGSLCHEISKCQKELFLRNLGSEMTWFDEKAMALIDTYKLSYLGYYHIPPATIAGLVGVEYFDWLNCTENELTHKIASKILPRAGLLISDNINLRFDLWKRDKYNNVIENLNIKREFSLNDLDISLNRPYTVETERRLMEIMALAPGIAKCFSRLDRNECVSLSAYLLYTPIFLNKCLSEITLEASTAKLIPLNILFPLETQYQRVRSLSEAKRYKLPLLKMRRSRLGVFYPAVSRNVAFAEVKDMMSSLWFGRGKLSVYNYNRMMKALKDMFPWFDENPEVCLKNSPFDTYLELKAFLETLSKREKPMKMISKADKVGDVLESLLEYDTYHGYRYTIGIVNEEQLNSIAAHQKMSKFEGAFLRWQKLAPFVDERISVLLQEHLEEYKTLPRNEVLSVINSFTKVRASFHSSMALVYGLISHDEFLRLTPNKFKLYIRLNDTTEKIVMKCDGKLAEFIVKNRKSVQSGVVEDLKVNWIKHIAENSLILSGTLKEGLVTIPEQEANFIIKKGVIRMKIGTGESNLISSPSSMGNIPFTINTGHDELNFLLTGWFNYSTSTHFDILKTLLKSKYTKECCRKMLQIAYDKSTIIRIRERADELSDPDVDQVQILREEKTVDELMSLVQSTLDDLMPDEEEEENFGWFEDFMQSTIASNDPTYDADPAQLVNTSCELMVALFSEVLNNHIMSGNKYIRNFLESAGIKPRSRAAIQWTSVSKHKLSLLT
jgi:hypothetical protein